jgi:cardiolipin synthase A/B
MRSISLLVAALALAIPASVSAQPQVVTGNADPNHVILSPGFQAQTDADTGYPLTEGNQFTLLENGVNSFPRKLDLARSATSSIFVTTMIASRDQTGTQFAQELIAAVARGVDVRCIFDGQRTDPRLVRILRRGGVSVILYNPFFSFGGRTGRLHMKMVVRDMRTAIVGGLNMADGYNLGDGVNRHYHDTDVLLEGDVAAEVAQSFLYLWQDLEPGDPALQSYLAGMGVWAPRPASGAGRVDHARWIVQESDEGSHSVRDYYRRCFDAATTQIVWHCNNIIPQGPVFEGLRDAAARGVRVTLITNSLRADLRRNRFFGFFQYYYLKWFTLRRLRGTGIEVWEIDTPIHSKALTIDGVMASVGSYNFSSTADKYLEATSVIYDPNVIRMVEEMMQRDLNIGRRIRL